MGIARLLRIVALSLTIIPEGYGVRAQTTSTGDLAELEQYTLTMDKVTRLMQAFGDLNKFGKEHPEAKPAMSDASDKESLADIEKRISRYPQVVSILRGRGFAVREFVVAELAILQAGMALAVDPSAKVAKGINPQNVTFMREHRAELAALQKEYGVNSD